MRFWMPLTLSLVLACPVFAASAVTPQQKENEEATKEAEAEVAKTGWENEHVLLGTLAVSPEASKTRPDLVGTFTAEDGRSFQIKLDDPTMLPVLLKYNNKKVRLTAQIRNAGKYVIPMRVAAPEVEAPKRRKKRGE